MIDAVSGRDAVVQQGSVASRPSGAAFHVADATDGTAVPSAAAEGTAAAQAVAPGMLMLQEAADESAPDQRARRRGGDLLRALAQLQRDLLIGEPGPACLGALADLLTDIPTADDPELGASVAAVALRARLELWRHGGAG